MRILLTNDDGIRAPGIVALFQALTDSRGTLGGPLRAPDGSPAEVFPVAPLTVQSATSHGVTFHEPIMVREVEAAETMRGVAVDARPADCVKLAISSIWPERFGTDDDGLPSRPDLVISGLNSGANCGVNVIYSGTVAAALEGAFLGVPSIAVSLMIRAGEPDFDTAAIHARRVVEQILGAAPLRRHECLNVNIPPIEAENPVRDRPLPVVVCPMNTHGLVDAYERRVSPSGGVYYWASGDGLDFHATDPGTDVHGLFDRKITITPLQYDLTRHVDLERWRAALGE